MKQSISSSNFENSCRQDPGTIILNILNSDNIPYTCLFSNYITDPSLFPFPRKSLSRFSQTQKESISNRISTTHHHTFTSKSKYPNTSRYDLHQVSKYAFTPNLLTPSSTPAMAYMSASPLSANLTPHSTLAIPMTGIDYDDHSEHSTSK